MVDFGLKRLSLGLRIFKGSRAWYEYFTAINRTDTIGILLRTENGM